MVSCTWRGGTGCGTQETVTERTATSALTNVAGTMSVSTVRILLVVYCASCQRDVEAGIYGARRIYSQRKFQEAHGCGHRRNGIGFSRGAAGAAPRALDTAAVRTMSIRTINLG